MCLFHHKWHVLHVSLQIDFGRNKIICFKNNEQYCGKSISGCRTSNSEAEGSFHRICQSATNTFKSLLKAFLVLAFSTFCTWYSSTQKFRHIAWSDQKHMVPIKPWNSSMTCSQQPILHPQAACRAVPATYSSGVRKLSIDLTGRIQIDVFTLPAFLVSTLALQETGQQQIYDSAQGGYKLHTQMYGRAPGSQ